ncbi:MAG: hypothetical protein ACYDDZ_02860 [Acidimicrobiales bacterium]
MAEPASAAIGSERTRAVDRTGWVALLAYGVVAVPLAVAVGRLVADPGSHVYLADDLALIDLHTRVALRWHQQLGAFDRYNWNHPGPSYFYLLSVFYRMFGSGPRALFVGSTTLNALAALGCVAVVHRRTSPTRALWAAVSLGLLIVILATTGSGTMTYSEGALGALVSPWNPMVIIFPVVLLALLAAAAGGSTVSFVWAVVVASYVIQTDISALPLSAMFLAVGAVSWAATVVVPRVRGRLAWRVRSRRTWMLGGAGVLTFVVMWIPPVVQQVTDQPGNLGLIVRFFSRSHSTQSWGSAWWAAVASVGVVVRGPAEVMAVILGHPPDRAGLVVAVFVAVVLVGTTVSAAGVLQRRRFTLGLGLATVLGCGITVVAAKQVIGPVYGYLMIWAVTVPIVGLIGVGTMALSESPMPRHAAAVRRLPVAKLALVGIGCLVCALSTLQVVRIPPLAAASDPQVGQLVALTSPLLPHRGTVLVNDAGAGGRRNELLDVERFIGLVDALDVAGFHPKVNSFWRAQFGPGYLSRGTEGHRIGLSTWTPSSQRLPGYVGRVGDIAVTVTGTVVPLG